MDLIYMNPNKEDIGVLKDYTLDMAFGSDENNFECTVSSSNNVCEAGFYLYAEGTEYGGIIDSINVDTEKETVIYKGRTWHGILDSKIFEPDAGNDYLVVKGEANTVLSTLISRMGLGNMFKVSSEASGINISHKMNRYISGYIGILRMLKANGAKLNITFKNGFVELSAKPFVDYSKDEQFDTDQISFTIQKNYKPINHVICLGQGDLKDRRVIHLYADGVGNISGTQTFTGVDEMCVTYDYSNAESDEELIEGGVEIIKASWASDSIEFDFESDDESFDINDVIGAVEFTTGTQVKASITKKIIKIQDYTTSISYSCESGVGTVASSGYPSSGSGSIVVDAYTKAETDTLLKKKSDTSHTHDDRYYTETEVDSLLKNKQIQIDTINSKILVGYTPVGLDDISNNLNNLAIGQTVSYGNVDVANVTNAPCTKAVRVYCIRGFGSNAYQIAFVYNDNRIFTRWCYNGTWGAWNDLTATSGDRQTLSTTYSTIYYKTGNMVTLTIDHRQVIDVGTITVGTLPSGYRPKQNIWIRNFNDRAYATINSSGRLDISMVESGWFIGSCCFGV